MIPMPQLLLSVDPSIVSLGWSLWINGEHVKHGAVRHKDNTQDMTRLLHICSQLEDVVRPYSALYRVTVIIDTPGAYSYKRSTRNGKSLNTGSLMKLTKVIGAIIGRLSLYAYHIEEIPVADWKGNQTKATAGMIGKVYGTTQSDIADSISLALWWFGQQQLKSRLPK
jgi:Holliday junction resolvasome RuvABC endonuclease subunit